MTFLTVIVGVAITGSMFAALLHWIVIPEMKKNGPGKQEDVLMPALIASFGAPIGLFLFGAWFRISYGFLSIETDTDEDSRLDG